jgi:hypothetical protein
MVLVEEIFDDEPVKAPAEPKAATVKVKEEVKEAVAPPTKLAPGFLEKTAEKPLYGPEGSPEGVVSADTHKAHAEHKMNEDMNKGMNRGAQDNNGCERPAWYTKEWPKDCQYNAPGCNLQDMETSIHATPLHQEMVRGSSRWQEALAPGVKTMRLSFCQATDDDIAELLTRLKDNEDVTEIDLSHNHIKDAGIQALVAALAGGAAPKLKELRLYSNDFGELGQTMLTQGLPVFRKKLVVHCKEPSWAHLATAGGAAATGEAAN